MAYLLLPSSRLAVYLAETQQLKVLPIRAEQYVLNTFQEQQVLATSYFKSLNFYDPNVLLKAEQAKEI